MRNNKWPGIFLVITLLGSSTASVAQETNVQRNMKQNSFELLFTHYNFMDGTPKLVILESFNPFNYGLSYIRASKSEDLILNVEFNYFQSFYGGTGLNHTFIPGDTWYRYNLYYSFNVYRAILKTRSAFLYGGGGLNFRNGSEMIHDGYFGGDALYHYRLLRDLGYCASLLGKIDLPYHFMLSTRVNFIRYFMLYDKNSFPSPYYPYDHGPSKNLFNIQLGIGYRFGKSNLSAAEKMARKERRDQKIRKNSVELNNSVSHFFDGTKTNWLIVYPLLNNNYDTSGNVSSSEIKYFLPLSLGLQYSRILNNENTIRFSVTHYNMGYGLYIDTKPSEVFRKNYYLFSTSYLYNLSSNKQLKVQALGELNYRSGFEDIVTKNIITPNGRDTETKDLYLNDWGLSAGLRVEQTLPKHFLLSAETKYTRFVYRGSKGIDFYGRHKDATANTFTIKLGVGYRF